MQQSTNIPHLIDRISSILDTLPDIEYINLSSGEPDYYGASWNIAKVLNMRKPLRSKASWRHGVGLGKINTDPITFTYEPPIKNKKYLVNNTSLEEHLRKHGYDAHAVGLPILYASQKETTRVKGSLLVMPRHVTTHMKRNFNSSVFPLEVKQLSQKFKLTAACISGQCVKHNIWMKQFENINIPWITGAWIFDKNALIRMRTIFQSFEYMFTDNIGSHIAYAAYCGCKVFLSENLQPPPTRKEYLKEPFYINYPQFIENAIQEAHPDNIRSKLPFLFKNYDQAKQHIKWAYELLGADHIRKPEEIADLLGWDKNEIVANKHYFLQFESQTAKFKSNSEKQDMLIKTFSKETGYRDVYLNYLHNNLITTLGKKIPGHILHFDSGNGAIASYLAYITKRHANQSSQVYCFYRNTIESDSVRLIEMSHKLCVFPIIKMIDGDILQNITKWQDYINNVSFLSIGKIDVNTAIQIIQFFYKNLSKGGLVHLATTEQEVQQFLCNNNIKFNLIQPEGLYAQKM